MAPAAHATGVHRRRLLRATGAVAAAGLAGCVGGQPADTPTPGDLPYSFTVASRRCGTRQNEASVSTADGTVTVEGTTWGADACSTGRLDDVSLDGDTLTVRVVTERAADTTEKACAQCITEIDYRLSVRVTAIPSTVVVVHDGETVLRTSP